MPLVFVALVLLVAVATGASAQPAPVAPDALQLQAEARRLISAYPDQLADYRDNDIIWRDGTRMLFDDGRAKTHQEKLTDPDLEDQVSECYTSGPLKNPPGVDVEPGRIRYEPFFKKMYGASAAEVESHLVSFRWAPSGEMLRATSVNNVAKRLAAVSESLANQGATIKRYVSPPLGGTFLWRKIAGENRLSAHSFGIALDVNTSYSDYWRWANPDSIAPWRNRIPFAIVAEFEKAGFIWGGKWQHFDTMHFEYRPEVFCGTGH